MKRPNIRLHVEQLVLDQFPLGDRYAIADAVQQELSRLFAEESVREDLTSTLIHNAGNGRLNAGAFQVEQNSRPNSIGAQIAQALHGRLIFERQHTR
jgi:hypothetical protein